MRKIFLPLCLSLFLVTALGVPVSAKIITTPQSSVPGSWTVFSKTIVLDQVPDQVPAKGSGQGLAQGSGQGKIPVELRIAVDSKYWLWVNGELVVFEGGLKRGPNPNSSYVDVFDHVKGLVKGKNKLDVLVWYFGKDGFSHKNSPVGGLDLFLKVGNQILETDSTWKAIRHPAYFVPAETVPNFRLSESNIGYDARNAIDYTHKDFNTDAWPFAQVVPSKAAAWGDYVTRPIPQWKNYGIKPFVRVIQTDSLWIGELPYNAQVTPFLHVRAPEGLEIDIRTDNYNGGSEKNVYARYITKAGEQRYESLGWVNGHQIHYRIPKGVEVLALGYRETGFDCAFEGSFVCSDPFYNVLWEKSQRTLYITMRDSYMDCPDRERAQWWGDVVNELGEAFYAMDHKAHLLTRKGIRELAHWQRADSTLYSPVPSGSWNKELPMQMLASVGYYGFWTYYWGSGDVATIREVFPYVQKYMHKWSLHPDGRVVPRKGGWNWGDWGVNQDMELLFNLWYHIALDGYARMARLVQQPAEALWAEKCAGQLKESVLNTYWNGHYYISPQHKGQPDDRAQALAVVSGMADRTQFVALKEFFQTHRHASPYMEKYVLQALCVMGYHQEALDRMKLRYRKMVESPITTLWEGWDIGSKTYGGGTYNHAWSGGPLTILSEYIAGVSATEPQFKRFVVDPHLGTLSFVKTTVPTVFGKIQLQVEKIQDQQRIQIGVPQTTEAEIKVPETCVRLRVNGVYKALSKRLVLKEGFHTVEFHEKL